MEKRTIYITEFDLKRLQERLLSPENIAARDKDHLTELGQELQRAEIVSPREVPHDVITMNSTVRLTDLDTHKEATYTLVFPAEADAAKKKISILAPIGTAMIGYRVGDVIAWKAPAGERRLRVEEVLYQPEAAGDFDR